MKAITRILSGAVLASVSVLFSVPLGAQVSESPARSQAESADGKTMASLSVAEIESAAAAVENDTGLEQNIKDLLRPKYKQAIETMQQAEAFAAQAASYREAIKTGPEATEKVRGELDSLPSVENAAKVTATGDATEIQKEIDSRRAARNAMSDELAKTTSDLALVSSRPAEISARLPVAQRELLDVRKQLESPEFAVDATSPARTADRLTLLTQEQRLVAELNMLEQEQLSLSVRDSLLQVQQELLTRQLENATAALNRLDVLAHKQLTNEAESVSALVRELTKDLPPGEHEARVLGREVQELATEFETVVGNLKIANDRHDALTARRKRLAEEFELVQEHLKLGGGGRAMAQVLLDLERRVAAASIGGKATLPSPEQTQLKSIKVREKLRQQSEVEQLFADHDSKPVAELVAARRDVLERLRTQYGNLNRALAVLEGDKRQSRDQSEEVRDFTREQLFWLRSSPSISIQTLKDLPGSIWWNVKGERWTELGAALLATSARRPMVSVLVVALAIVLLLLRGRIGAALGRAGANLRRISTDRYAYTTEALLWTFLLTVPIPVLLGYAGWLLAQYPEPSEWLRGFTFGLRIAAWITFWTILLSVICRPGGLGEAHLQWKSERLTPYRRALFAFTVGYAPAMLLTVSSAYGEVSQGPDSAARVSFMLVHLWTAIVLWRLLRSPNGILVGATAERPNGGMTRQQNVLSASLLACPLALVLLAGTGYVITAYELSIGLFATFVITIGGSVLYGLVLRWFMMKQRKLALAEAIERRRARQIAAAEDDQGPAEGDVVSVDSDEEEELDLDAITHQTRHFLGLLFMLSVATTIIVFWSSTFPLTEAVDSIILPLGMGLSLLDLVRAILIVVITWITVGNLPGLLELAVLRATSIDAGTRNAITTLCQYAATAIGIGMLLAVLNVDWTRFGWIAAALSVGLGFGLQEVVANFVCGLILLFERPIRVGDIVVVEGVTGTVTKIHLRTTTITNWDREELIVPNKTLITNTLLNLTLSSPVNRILLPVGVAYGSDTERARQILTEVAAAHPEVLDDPPPTASFELLADSSINLMLRAFLPNRDRRLTTLTELHTEVVRRFAEAGIEIAFPQQDVHFRSGWENLTRKGSEKA